MKLSFLLSLCFSHLVIIVNDIEQLNCYLMANKVAIELLDVVYYYCYYTWHESIRVT